jgi:hypothetical protein
MIFAISKPIPLDAPVINAYSMMMSPIVMLV